MRIVQIGGALAGAQKTIEEAIHCSLRDQGHDSCILYACGAPSMDGEICYESKIENLLTRGLRKYVAKRPVFSFLQTLRLIRCIARFDPDVVHLHVLHHGYTDYELLLRFLARAEIPVVYTMHDMWAFTGGCYYYTALECDGYRRGCPECPEDGKNLDVAKGMVSRACFQKRHLLGKLNRLHLVAVSRWVEREIRGSSLAEYPITVIPNGVKVETVSASKARMKAHNHGKTVLISVATSWSDRKGILLLFELAKLLGPAYEIRLVGSVSPGIRMQAPSNIVFLGYIGDRAELCRYYHESDLYVSVSREETFGMTFVEAALMGIRSVGYADTAVGETLEMVCGMAVDDYSAEAFAKTIRMVLSRNLGRLTPEQIAEVQWKCSAERMAKDYMNLYLKTIKGD